MNPASTSFVLGYHGCDRKVAERVLSGRQSLQPSVNDYDWLGDGIYFWEHNARRAYEFAIDVRDQPRHRGQKIKDAAVVGAIIDLGFCLNLLDSHFIGLVRHAYDGLAKLSEEAGTPMPRNSLGRDLLLRKLDCAVIRFLHATREDEQEEPFDTVRAVFLEGGTLYEKTQDLQRRTTFSSAFATFPPSRDISGRLTRTASRRRSRDRGCRCGQASAVVDRTAFAE